MLVKSLLTLLLAASASAAALPISPRETCAWQCNSVCYWQSDIDAAVNQGYSLYESGSNVNNYPHQYENREGFYFDTQGPWYEFPILRSFDVYNGGSPGADRVIFNSQGQFTAVLSHDGESGNNFGECTV